MVGYLLNMYVCEAAKMKYQGEDTRTHLWENETRRNGPSKSESAYFNTVRSVHIQIPTVDTLKKHHLVFVLEILNENLRSSLMSTKRFRSLTALPQLKLQTWVQTQLHWCLIAITPQSWNTS